MDIASTFSYLTIELFVLCPQVLFVPFTNVLLKQESEQLEIWEMGKGAIEDFGVQEVKGSDFKMSLLEGCACSFLLIFGKR